MSFDNRYGFIFKEVKNYRKNNLHDHILRDFDLVEDRTLHILDNYNVKSISNDLIRFYVDAFRNTNINKIIFYYEVRNSKVKVFN